MFLRRALAIIAVTLLTSASVDAQSRVTELNDAGWKALHAGDPGRASALFAEALRQLPQDPVLLFGAGAAAHMQGRQRDAMGHLQKSLAAKPGLTAASLLLGKIAYEEGDSPLAIKTYEQALKYAPLDDDLKRGLELFRKDADTHRTFEERRFERFRVMFEGRSEESLATRATEIFNSAFFRISNTLGEYPPHTIVAVLYTEQQFRDITRAPGWAGGLYDGRIRIPAAGAAQHPQLFEEVMTHELTHAIIAGIAPGGVPAWLNEGLAQYFDGSDPREAQRRLRAVGASVPLKHLERSFGRLNAAQAQIAYDEALLAVSVMAERPGFGWVRLLHRLSDGEPFEQAIKNFGFSYEDLEAPFSK